MKQPLLFRQTIAVICIKCNVSEEAVGILQNAKTQIVCADFEIVTCSGPVCYILKS